MKKNNVFLQTQFFERDVNLCIHIFLHKLQIRWCQIKLQKNDCLTTAFVVCFAVEFRPEERNRLTGWEKGWEGFLSDADKKNTNPDVKGAVMEALIRGVFVWRETAWGLHFQERCARHSLSIVGLWIWFWYKMTERYRLFTFN